ncbi:MAG: type II secretion system F family protein [Pirellulales bacterium]|nr:type II secretion system F family protein [Pirellulales bacterium]
MSIAILTFLGFAAATTAALAVALSIRDIRAAAAVGVDRRIGLDRLSGWDLAKGLELPVPQTGINRLFAELVEQSGVATNAATALAIVAGTGVVGLAAPLLLLENIPLAAAGLLLGTLTPLAYLAIKRWRRRKLIAQQLPEAMEILADGVRSGRSFEQAMELVARDAPAPLSQEFADSASQLRLGQSPVAVLERMVCRLPLAEFKILAITILVHRQTGGNLALLVERLAAATRDRQEFRGHVRAMTAGSKISAIGLFVGTFAAVGLLAWMEPAYLGDFLASPMGPPLLAVAIVLDLVGFVWVWRIAKVDY